MPNRRTFLRTVSSLPLAGGLSAAATTTMPQRDFLQTILQRGNRFMKQFRQRIAQSLSIETTERSSHEIKPTEHQRTTARHVSV